MSNQVNALLFLGAGIFLQFSGRYILPEESDPYFRGLLTLFSLVGILILALSIFFAIKAKVREEPATLGVMFLVIIVGGFFILFDLVVLILLYTGSHAIS